MLAQEPSSRTTKRKQRLTSDFTIKKEVYHETRRRYKSGDPLTDACKKSGIGRSTLYSKRFIIEMMETDESTFTDLAVQETIPKYPSTRYKQTLDSSPFKRLHADLRKNGKLLH